MTSVFGHDAVVAALLHNAARSGDLGEVARLLAAGADVDRANNNGTTPLHCASRNGHDAVVAALLTAGADANAEITDGRTPLHWASLKGHGAVVARLLAARAKMLSCPEAQARSESTDCETSEFLTPHLYFESF